MRACCPSIASHFPLLYLTYTTISALAGRSADEKFNRLSTHVFHGISCEVPVGELYDLGVEIGKGEKEVWCIRVQSRVLLQLLTAVCFWDELAHLS